MSLAQNFADTLKVIFIAKLKKNGNETNEFQETLLALLKSQIKHIIKLSLTSGLRIN